MFGLIWDGIEGAATVLGIGAAAKSLSSSGTSSTSTTPTTMSATEMALIGVAAWYLWKMVK